MVHEMKVVSFCLACAGVVGRGLPQPSAGRASPTAPSPTAVDTRPQQPFDARGYYFPRQVVTIEGRRLEWLELARHYASIKLSSTPADSEPRYIDCGRAIISPDTLEVTCRGVEPIGSITIRGAFLDKKGGYRDRDMGHDIVLATTVTYKALGGERSTFLVQYHYSNQEGGN
jgi:hypothetical protein